MQAVLAVLEGQNRMRLIPFSGISLSRVSCSHAHDQVQCQCTSRSGPREQNCANLASVKGIGACCRDDCSHATGPLQLTTRHTHICSHTEGYLFVRAVSHKRVIML